MDAAEQVDDQDASAARHVEQIGAAARRVSQDRIVERPDQTLFSDDVGQRLLLIPGMVAQGDAVGARGEDFARGVLGNAEAGGGVLAIDHHEIEGEAAAESR